MSRYVEKHLTPAQVRVAVLVSNGLTNREIATQTGCAEKTVKNHLNAIYHSSAAVNRRELVHHVGQGTLANPAWRDADPLTDYFAAQA